MALWATLAKGARPEARIDMPRDEWQRDMDGTHRRIDALLRRAPLAGSGQEPVGHNVMLRV